MARTWTMTPRLWQPVCKAQVQNWVRNLKTGVAKLTRRRPTVIEKHARDSGSACEESLQRFFFLLESSISSQVRQKHSKASETKLMKQRRYSLWTLFSFSFVYSALSAISARPVRRAVLSYFATLRQGRKVLLFSLVYYKSAYNSVLSSFEGDYCPYFVNDLLDQGVV